MAVIKMNFFSQALGTQANITVCLPSWSMADSVEHREAYVPGMKYQTLYLLHGGGGDDSDFVHFTNIVRYAEKHKLAVVMPADYNRWYANDPRGGARYFDYVVDELPKVCRTLFPLSDKREDNFIGGLSMGMQGASKCAVLRPDLYAAALLMSGTAMSAERYRRRWEDFHKGNPTWGGGGAAIFSAMGEPDSIAGGPEDTFYNAEQHAQKGTQMPKFFITSGSEDPNLPGTLSTRDHFQKLGFDVTYEEVPGYSHEWDFWDLTLRKALDEWLPIRHAPIYPDK